MSVMQLFATEVDESISGLQPPLESIEAVPLSPCKEYPSLNESVIISSHSASYQQINQGEKSIVSCYDQKTLNVSIGGGGGGGGGVRRKRTILRKQQRVKQQGNLRKASVRLGSNIAETRAVPNGQQPYRVHPVTYTLLHRFNPSSLQLSTLLQPMQAENSSITERLRGLNTLRNHWSCPFF